MSSSTVIRMLFAPPRDVLSSQCSKRRMRRRCDCFVSSYCQYTCSRDSVVMKRLCIDLAPFQVSHELHPPLGPPASSSRVPRFLSLTIGPCGFRICFSPTLDLIVPAHINRMSLSP